MRLSHVELLGQNVCLCIALLLLCDSLPHAVERRQLKAKVEAILQSDAVPLNV